MGAPFQPGFEGGQLVVHIVTPLQAGELTLKIGASQFGSSLAAGLENLHLLLHLLESSHRGVGAEIADRALQLLLGLGRLGAGLEHFFFGLGLSDLGLKGRQTPFKGVDLACLTI